jgi:hypothetical protein
MALQIEEYAFSSDIGGEISVHTHLRDILHLGIL